MIRVSHFVVGYIDQVGECWCVCFFFFFVVADFTKMWSIYNHTWNTSIQLKLAFCCRHLHQKCGPYTTTHGTH